MDLCYALCISGRYSNNGDLIDQSRDDVPADGDAFERAGFDQNIADWLAAALPLF